jgi:hypothetical protein
MSGIPPLKRRRLDSALHKPFKSPLKTPLGDSASSSTNGLRLPLASPLAKTMPVVPIAHDKENSAALKSRAITSTRRDIETLNQALSILDTAASDRDGGLQLLISKWQQAARLAAEEVFEMAQTKIDRNGGVRAWRQQERDQREQRRTWEHEDREMERTERIKSMREEAKTQGATEEEIEEMLKENGVIQDTHTTGDEMSSRKADDETNHDFTIETMLKSMGLNLQAMGYNESTAD